ncbi:MAG: hypothetical protein ACI8XB_000281 [Patiriisocius sp.]|jgi:hypothetical protein
MKKLLLSLLCIGVAGLYSAQDVITFFEGFQDTSEDGDVLFNAVEDPFNTEDDQWANYDADGLPTNADNGGNWYIDFDIRYQTLEEPGEGGADTNFVARSDSWLGGFAPENRNYLILPEIEITDESHFLSWKSGAFQGPRYMDGYSVGIVTDIEDAEGSYVKLWSAAQFVGDDNAWHPALYGTDYDFSGCPVPGDPVLDQDLSTVCYHPEVGDGLAGTGYVHANEFSLPDYLGFSNDDETGTTWLCLLEPHEISLADYIGETLRICFRHDSDDDNFITIDDLMVSSGIFVGVPEIAFARFISMFPNPVSDQLNFNFTEEVKDNAVINVIDAKGSIVYSEVANGTALRNAFSIDMSSFSAGLYSVSVTIDNKQTISSNIVKK